MPGRPSGYTKPSGWTSTIVPRILNRDGRICYICHQPGATSVDHKVPVSQGGSHEDTNLAAIHPTPCHRDKTERERRQAIANRSRKRQPRQHPNTLG